MKFNRAFLLFALVLVTLAACSTPPVIPAPGPRPTGMTFDGVWYSSQFEHMYLRQTGDQVRGIYTYKYGGTLEGKISGNLLTFIWVDPGSKQEARRGMKGNGYLQMLTVGDQVKLIGEWGYGDDPVGGGPWEAEYVRKLTQDDPRDLKDLP